MPYIVHRKPGSSKLNLSTYCHIRSIRFELKPETSTQLPFNLYNLLSKLSSLPRKEVSRDIFNLLFAMTLADVWMLHAVPDSPRDVTDTVKGTSIVLLEWVAPAQIRGNKKNLTYIVTVGNTSSKGPLLSITLDNNPPGSKLTIQVVLSFTVYHMDIWLCFVVLLLSYSNH